MNSPKKHNPKPQESTHSAYTFTFPFLLLLLLTVVVQLVAVAYTAEQHFSEVLFPSVIALLIVTAPLAALGLWLGTQIGLGTPLLTALLSRSPGAGRQLVRDAVLAVSLGLVIGAFLWILRIVVAPYLPPELPELGHRGVMGGLLVSISAAVGEEVWLRLGVMTIIAWLLQRLSGHAELKPKVAWAAIVSAAIIFSLIHLPQLAAADAATPTGIIATVFGNTLVGMAFGWLFWRHSLIAAILAHFSVDLVLHVLPALIV
jgi:membrane protease YdiL (CAAX protease family)